MESSRQTSPDRAPRLGFALHVAACLAAIGFALAGPARAQSISWDMATSAGPESGQARATQTFVANLSARTEGQLAVTAHPPQSLMKPLEIKDAVRRGVIAMGEFTLSLHAGEAPVYGLDTLPLIATSYADARRLYDAQRPLLEKRLAEEGLKLLYSAPYLAQSLCADRAVVALPDLQGLRLRVYNHLTKKLAVMSGAIPVAVDTADIPNAINTGRLDAFIASAGQVAARKAWIVAPYFHDLAIWIPRNAVVVNKAQFEALPADIRKAMLDAAKFAEDRAWDAAAKDHAERGAWLAKAGAAVVPASAEFRQALAGIGRRIAEDWGKQAGAEAQAVLEGYWR